MKDDLRSRLSRKILKDALLELLTYRKSYDISVSELCDKAGINRSTFYRHYGNIGDILEEIDNELVDIIANANSASINDPENALNYIYATLSSLEQHREYDALILANEEVFRSLIRRLEPMVFDSLRVLTQKEDKELRYLVKYLLNGTYAVIHDWAVDGRKEPVRDIADMIYRLSVNMMTDRKH